MICILAFVSSCKLILEIDDQLFNLHESFQCSASCGIGTRRRQVTCVGHRCREDVKPVEIMSCNRGACPGWNYGQWAPVRNFIIKAYYTKHLKRTEVLFFTGPL